MPSASQLLEVLRTRPDSNSLQQENEYLKRALSDAAEVIIRCLGSQEEFDGDAEEYCAELFEISNLDRAA